MTVPVQRGPGSGEDATVLNLVLDGMRDLKDQVVRLETHLGGRLDNLDQRYIPRAEYEARHSDVRQQITETRASLTAEGTQREALENSIVQGRRWAIGAALAAFSALVGLAALIVTVALTR